MRRKILMKTANVCYGLLALFMIVCAIWPERMFKGLHPDKEALYAFASLAVFVWILLVYLSIKYLPNNGNIKNKS